MCGRSGEEARGRLQRWRVAGQARILIIPEKACGGREGWLEAREIRIWKVGCWGAGAARRRGARHAYIHAYIHTASQEATRARTQESGRA